MRTFFKKKTLTFALTAATLASSSLYAQQDGGWQDFACQTSLIDSMGCCSEDFFLDVEYLYWKATEDGLGYGVKQTVLSPPFTTPQYVRDTIKDPSLGWDSGYRLGLGYNLPSGGWNSYLSWTHFNTSARNHDNSVPTNFTNGTTVNVRPIFSVYTAAAPTNLSNRFKLNVNWVDLELGKRFNLADCVSLRPHIGFRAASVHQNMRTRYISSPTVTFASFNGVTKLQNNYHGIGLRAGFDTHWEMGNGFTFIGSSAGAILAGSYDIHEKERFNNVLIPQSLRFRLKDDYNACRGVLDFGVAIRWDTVVWENYYLGLQLGYEQHLFFNQNQLRNLNSGSPLVQNRYQQGHRGDLTLHGLTLAANLRF